jgi:hypothetical protein
MNFGKQIFMPLCYEGYEVYYSEYIVHTDIYVADDKVRLHRQLFKDDNHLLLDNSIAAHVVRLLNENKRLEDEIEDLRIEIRETGEMG